MALVAARELARQRQEALHQLLARRRVALLVVADQQPPVLARAAAGAALGLPGVGLAVVLSLGLRRGSELGLAARSSEQTRRGERSSRHDRARRRGYVWPLSCRARRPRAAVPSAWRSRRETCIWDMPSRCAISAWVMSSLEAQPQDQRAGARGSARSAGSIVTAYSTRS